MSAEEEFPVSFAQQRLWFLEQLEDVGAAYTVRLPVRLRGALDAALVQRAVDALVERHEALRTRIATRAGVPVQLVAEALRIPVETVAMDGADAVAVRSRVTALAREPLRLAGGPMVRVLLVRAARDDHVLLVLAHHAIADAWSMGVLFRDFAELYAGLAAGRPAALPPLDVQYADFAAWQREGLQGEELDRQLRYWTQTLAGAPALLELPTDRPRPPVQTWRGSRWTRILARDAVSRVRSYSAARGATVFMTLLAAFDALLGRQAGAEEVVVGTPVAGRRRTELEPVVGFFANTLAIRCDLSGDPSFDDLVARVKRASLDAWAHQDLPFEKLVEALNPARSLSHAPVFQVMFILQNAPWEAGSMPGIEASPAEIDATEAAKFDLTLSATEYDGEIWLAFEYNTDLFDAATIERMAAHYEWLLAAALDRPAARVGELPLEDPAAARARMDAWNATFAAPEATSASTLVGLQVQARRDAIAVEMGDRRWTYAALDDWADTLADRLSALGAGRGGIVGIALERSPEMIGALLAVMRSGAAWLPLDPSYPQARLQDMLDDSGARLLVTSRALATRFAAHEGAVLAIDDLAPAACSATARRAAPPAGNDTAYLIYTSGSTGKPKGVTITHGALANFIASMLRVPGLAAGERLLAVTTLSFDIALLELLGPLCAGGTVVLATTEEARDGAALARRIGSGSIDVMQATPATWRALLTSGWTGCATGLRILCGGEALDAELASRLLGTGAELWNLYGPTETTVWSSCARITDARDVTAGRPIANTQLWVVDARGEPLPPGVPGELLIGGAGVSPGYHRRPELTAERFVATPLAGGAMAYRTGDRARFLADGRVQILGRLDRQVKIRGFRIEPGEVEVALAGVAGVRACAVEARDSRLVAWVVGDGPGDRWREALKGRLPEYMLPSSFVAVEALPLTPNGKVDRRALKVPASVDPVAVADEPRSPLEATLAALFAEVLGRSAVGIREDFFALGGHSLLATRLVARIRDVLGIELPLKALFEAPAVAPLAEAIGRDGRAVTLPPVERRPATRAPLSWMQQRLWFLEQLEPGNPAYHLHVAYRLEGAVDAAALEGALNAVIARHESLRTRFVADDGEPVQVIDAVMRLPLEGLAPADFVGRPFDLARGPLLRAALVPAAGESTFLLVLHHIVSDGWSVAVLMREIGIAYDALVRGRAPDLAPLQIQYADYAIWQRRHLEGEALARQLDWWRRELDGAPQVLSLPADRPRLPVQRHRGARLAQDVSRDVVDAVHALARESACTPFMVLLAAFETLLARYGGDEELCVGTPVAGRGRTELEGLVGFFVNTLVMRGDLRGNPPFRELLDRVRRTAIDAFAHADLPFERIVDELKPRRDPGRTPLFQVMFNLHSEPAAEPAFEGLRATRIAVPRHTSKFDLSVSLVEHAGGLSATFEYDTDLFDRETVACMAESYATLLGEVARDADRPIGDYALNGPRARERIEAEARRVAPGAARGIAWEGTLAARFAAQVAAHGERPAVVWRDGAWTYAQLDARAQAIARQIAAAGPDGPVALLLGHDAVMIAGLLAAVLARRAWVPLDRYSPEARNCRILEDSGASVIVTDASGFESGLPRIVIGAETPGAVPASSEPRGEDDRIAYLLYTSGTTGQPKGVVQSERGLLGQIRTWSRQLELRPTDRLTLLSGYGYDAAVQDIFGALLNGASLHPMDLRGGDSGPELVDRIAEEGITVIHATPTVYRHLFGGRVTCAQDLSRVRLVVLGGEEARRSDLELFRLRFARGARFVNGLGLTESTTGLQYFADHDTRVLGDRLPVGRPVPGTGAILLGGSWQGELALESDHLALGYHRDPALTAERFPGGRRLLTRDRLRRLPDGQYVHAGRLDRQLKIRGIRIEPGEIEAALRDHAGVADCVVGTHESHGGEPLLVAWIVTRAEIETVRATLRRQLPEHLVPQAIVALDALPRRANGKVDRAALPAPSTDAAAGRAPVPPRSEIEERLAAIWCGVLGSSGIGVHDDFFALGGHSLLATRLIARVRDAFAVEVPLVALFEGPSVAAMAAAIERAAARAPEPGLPALKRRPRPAARPGIIP